MSRCSGSTPKRSLRLAGWRDDFSESSPREARSGTRRRSRGRSDRRSPGDARTLRVDATGTGVTLAAVALREDGRGIVIDLGPIGRRPLSVAIRRGARAFVRLVVRPTTRVLERGADSDARSSAVPARSGRCRRSAAFARVVGRRRRSRACGRDRPLRADGPGDRAAPSSARRAAARVVTPGVAAAADSDGILTLRVAGDAVRVRVARVARRIPGHVVRPSSSTGRHCRRRRPRRRRRLGGVDRRAETLLTPRRRRPSAAAAVRRPRRRFAGRPRPPARVGSSGRGDARDAGRRRPRGARARRRRPRAARARRRPRRAGRAARPRGAGRGAGDAPPAAASARRHPRGRRPRVARSPWARCSRRWWSTSSR